MNEAAKQTRRTRLLIAVALGVLATYAVISILSAREARQRLSQAQDNLTETRVKLREIAQLQKAPRVASLNLESPGDISKRIDAALQAAGLTTELLDQNPDAPQQVQKTDYQIRATSIDLAPSTLSQILKFCDALQDPETGSVVRDLTLTPPQNPGNTSNSGAGRRANQGGQEKWEAQMTLTQMIFSPKRPE